LTLAMCSNPDVFTATVVRLRKHGEGLVFADVSPSSAIPLVPSALEESSARLQWMDSALIELCLVPSSNFSKNQSNDFQLLEVGDVLEVSGLWEKDEKGKLTFRGDHVKVTGSEEIDSHAITQAHKERMKEYAQRLPEKDRPLCRFFRRSQIGARSSGCTEKGCPFRHFLVNEEEKASMVELKRKRDKEIAKLRIRVDRDVHSCKEGHGQRAIVFVQWLLDRIGKEVLGRGSGVLDIAGGRGEVSWHLQVNNGVRSTVIDPREVKPIKKKKRKELKKKGVESGPSVIRAFFDDTFTETEKHKVILDDASFVIGMHPDEATEVTDGRLYFQYELLRFGG